MLADECSDVPCRIAIIMFQDATEALALRQAIEVVCAFTVPVDLVAVPRSRDLIAALKGEESDARHLVLCCHGVDGEIILDELHPCVAAGEPYNGRFGADAVRKEADLNGQVVLSTGCSTGSLASAFLSAGAGTYIASAWRPVALENCLARPVQGQAKRHLSRQEPSPTPASA